MEFTAQIQMLCFLNGFGWFWYHNSWALPKLNLLPSSCCWTIWLHWFVELSSGIKVWEDVRSAHTALGLHDSSCVSQLWLKIALGQASFLGTCPWCSIRTVLADQCRLKPCPWSFQMTNKDFSSFNRTSPGPGWACTCLRHHLWA